jgi:pimeloyl-ACP methyl ester carboxylesterase
MTEKQQHSTIILVPGHWLGAWAWEDVVARLTELGHNALALTLPGLHLDDDRSSTTPMDQAEAVISEMSQAYSETGQPIVLVGHSGANAPISLALDRHPELVRRVIWVDSGPVSDGTVFDPDAEEHISELALPDFDVLSEQASLEGLDAEVLDRFRRQAVPEPGLVLTTPVTLTNEKRHNVPTTLVCCSLPSTQLMELTKAGHPMFAEVAALQDVELVDLPTGHWPMWSRPDALATIISNAVTAPSGATESS